MKKLIQEVMHYEMVQKEKEYFNIANQIIQYLKDKPNSIFDDIEDELVISSEQRKYLVEILTIMVQNDIIKCKYDDYVAYYLSED